MKKVGILFFSICLIVMFTVKTGAAQQLSGKSFSELPVRHDIKPKASQQIAWGSFKTTHPDWKIRWGNHSRVPASLLGPPVHVTTGTPEQIARTFLQSHRQLLAMRSDLSDLQLIKVEQRRATHVSFQQKHEGIPVEGAVYSVNMTKKGNVYYASGDYFEEISVSAITPSISKLNAIELAEQDLGSTFQADEDSEAELVILPYGDEFRLSWKVTIPAQNPLGRWVYYISAQDGSILTGYNSMDTATDDGDVYDHHPDAGPVVTRTLTHLSGAGDELDGSYVKVYNADASEIDDGDFTYSPTNTHFDEVMVYYHATEFQKFMGNEVNYPHLNYPSSVVQVQATVHYGTNWNNAHAVSPNIIRFGDGDGSIFNDLAKEDNVIAHEYQHLITNHITYNELEGPYSETDAMDEGFSDYFAGTYAGSADIGVYIVPGAGQLREMDNSFTMSDWDDPSDPLQTYHDGSQIFTGALWDMRQELGASTANVLIFEGLDNLNFANPLFIDAMDAILAADHAFYSGNHVPDILEIFEDREIGNTSSGSITSNTTWSVEMHLTGDVTVDNNAVLTISAGTSVYLDNNVDLVIEPGAKLIADGTSSDPIHFKRANPNYAWGQISLESSEGNLLDWCLIEGGNDQVYIASKNNTISHTTIRNATNNNIETAQNQDGSGNSSADISYTLIDNAYRYGVRARYTDLDMSYTTIQNNGARGLYISFGSSIYPFHHNVVTNNGGYNGVQISSGSELYLHNTGFTKGYNEIYDNGDDQISVSGDLYIGEYVHPDSYNSIRGDYSGGKYLISNNTGFTLEAFFNHWDEDDSGYQSPVSGMFEGTVSAPSYLTSNPAGGYGYQGQAPSKIRADDESPTPLAEAYEEAEQLLGQAETIQQVRDQLYTLYKLVGMSQDPSLKDRFKQMAQAAGEGEMGLYASGERNVALKNVAIVLYAKSLIRDEGYKQAHNFLKKLDISELTGYDKRDYLHLRMVTEIYHEEYEAALQTLQAYYGFQKSQGANMEELKAEYLSLEEELQALIKSGGGQESIREKQSEITSEPEAISMANYPNPFNPTTNIKFTLPERSQVSLIVYDMLGREVATLVNETLPAGEQTVPFDASRLANGVYLYKLRSGSQEITRKMTLIK